MEFDFDFRGFNEVGVMFREFTPEFSREWDGVILSGIGFRYVFCDIFFDEFKA